jgi:peptidoglycan-associated lipoprotein
MTFPVGLTDRSPRDPRPLAPRAPLRAAALAALLVAAACSRTPPPGAAAPQAAADSAAAAAQRDSLALAARRDSLATAARRDSALAAARADSAARVAREASRADSVRAQVQRNAVEEPAAVRSGLDSAASAELGATLYFEYNRSDLTAAAVAVLERKLRVLQGAPRLAIQVAGHCDERGSDEYNLALGERRAASVLRYLVEHGIAAGRLSVMSYGEERPLDPGHTEEAWAKNRRAEFTVTEGAR